MTSELGIDPRWSNSLATDLGQTLYHTRDLFESLRNKRLFITGGTGFFGHWLLESFTWANYHFDLNASAVVLTRTIEAFQKKSPHLSGHRSIRLHVGDVRDFKLPDGEFHFVIHAATAASLKLEQENPDEMYSVIVDGTRRVLDFAVQAKASRFMLTSSGAVYGTQPAEMSHISESYSGVPATSYGKGKLLAEQMCVEAGDCYGFTALLPRCFAFVGPYLNLDIHFAIGNFIRDCLENRPILIKGDGTPLRSYLYAADLSEWLWTILLRGSHNRPYNVGSDQSISILALAQLVQRCAGSKNAINTMGTALSGQAPSRYVPSIERARNELGLGVRTSLQDAICRTLDFERSRC